MIKYKNKKLYLGNSAFANFFHKKGQSKNNFKFKPKLSTNKDSIIKLENKINLINIKPRFNWVTCFEPDSHLKKFYIKIMKSINFKKNYKISIGGFSFKDKPLLDKFSSKNFKKQILDPKKDFKIRNSIFLAETIIDKFENLEIDHKTPRLKFDILIVRHVLEHSRDIHNFIHKLMNFVKNEGYLVIEVPDCGRSMKYGDPSMIWEEHKYYFTYNNFINFCKTLGYKIIFKYSYKDSLDDSVVCCLQKKTTKSFFNKNYKDSLSLFKYYIALNKNFIYTKNTLNNYSKKGKIAIYGASHLTFSFINIFNLHKYFLFIIDDNKNKLNYLSPVNLSIVPLNQKNLSMVKYCLLGVNPNHHDSLKKKIHKINNKIKVFSIFPSTKYFYGKT